VDGFWVGFLVFMFYIPIVFLWAFGFYDLIRRRDLDAWGKALWAILFFPLLGVLFYFIRALEMPRGGRESRPARTSLAAAWLVRRPSRSRATSTRSCAYTPTARCRTTN
jgi:hypothetical protein